MAKEETIKKALGQFCKESGNRHNGIFIRILNALVRLGYNINVDSAEDLMNTIDMSSFVRTRQIGQRSVDALYDFFNWVEAKEKEEMDAMPDKHVTIDEEERPMTAQEYATARLAIERELDEVYKRLNILDLKYYNETPKPFPIGTKVRLTLENTPNCFAPGGPAEGERYTREGYIQDWEVNHNNGELRPDILSKGGKRQHYYFYHPIVKMEEVE